LVDVQKTTNLYDELTNETPDLAPIFKINQQYAKLKFSLVNHNFLISNQIIDEFVQVIKDWRIIFEANRPYFAPVFAYGA